jgi:hypothetical protein
VPAAATAGERDQDLDFIEFRRGRAVEAARPVGKSCAAPGKFCRRTRQLSPPSPVILLAADEYTL